MTENQESNLTRSTLLGIALIAAGLAGNYFKFEIFLNLDFLFGSIFALLALQLFGLGRGILAAAIIASPTFFLWNHPYAIIIMTTEVAVVGWLTDQRKTGLVLADTLYWVIIGIPLVFLFYHVWMHVPLNSAYVVMTKQAVNGITNALIARLIFTAYSLRSRASLMSYRDIIYNLMAFFVLCPALVMLIISSRTDFSETDLDIRKSLKQDSWYTSHSLQNWVMNRTSAIVNLAEMAASRPPQQMQPFLELSKKSDVNFRRIGLMDNEAVSTAFYPLLDELGHQNIGKNFSDRPYIPMLKQRLKPMLSEVVMARIGVPKPMIAVLAPVIIQGEYGGYIGGILDLEQLRERLDNSHHENSTHYTLIDKNGIVIMTNRTDQAVMTPFGRGKGTINHLDSEISQWIPVVPSNTPNSVRWSKSFYVAETDIGDLAEWKLILEQPVAPFQKTLYKNFTGRLTLLFLILLVALALAEFLSRRSILTLESLRQSTCDLPGKLMDRKEIDWPESRVIEMNALCHNFKETAFSLREKYQSLQQTRDSLKYTLERFYLMLSNMYSGILLMSDEGRIEFTNQTFCDVYGLKETPDELADLPSNDLLEKILPAFLYPEQAAARILEILKHGKPVKAEEFAMQDGRTAQRDFVPLHIQGKSCGRFWVHLDITARKRAEEALRKSEERHRLLSETMLQGVVHHDANGKIVAMNPAAERILGKDREQFLGSSSVDEAHQTLRENGQSFPGLDHPSMVALRTGQQVRGVVMGVFNPKAGDYRWISIDAVPVIAPGRIHPSEVYTVFEDITERKQIDADRERLLINAQNNAAELDATISSISIGLIVYNTAGKAIRLNNVAEKLLPAELFFGMTVEERYQVLHWETKSGVAFPLEEMPITLALRGETTQNIVMAGLFPDHKLWISVSAAPIRTSDGRMLGAVATFIDITDNIRAEEKIMASLTEKEVLLKEIHHRVKNNMQVISSLISLQADSLADEQLTGVLGDVRDRVRTMALVHEKLYQTEDLARLNFAEYMSSLLNYLWSAHSATSRNLHLNMSLVPLILPVDISVNCGLILNELASNAIKHAFPGVSGGEVVVTLEHDSDTGAVCLRVRDNGVGLPADLDWRQSSSLGLRLVQMLTGQIRGTVQTGPGPGTEFQISFNIKGIPS